MQRAFLLIIVLSISIVSFAEQQAVPLALPDPAPAWPASGVVPPDMKDKYVFVDNEKNEFVVAYPENLGTPTFEKDGPGPLRIARFELLRSVAPAVSVSVSAAPGGTYKYAYTIGNGAAAKQSIDQFSIVTPQPAKSINKPAGWFAVIQGEKTFKVQNPEWIKTGSAAVWSFQKPEAVIQPGGQKSEFELESALRPGFTIGYFRKAESVEVKVAASGTNIPEAVKTQKDELLSLEYNSKTVLMLGPKFAADADDKTIAADFAQGITTLGRTGALSPDSEFVKAAVAELNRVASAGSPAKIAAQPRPGLETEIFNALKVSLKLN
jgi:hypothetical protein